MPHSPGPRRCCWCGPGSCRRALQMCWWVAAQRRRHTICWHSSGPACSDGVCHCGRATLPLMTATRACTQSLTADDQFAPRPLLTHACSTHIRVMTSCRAAHLREAGVALLLLRLQGGGACGAALGITVIQRPAQACVAACGHTTQAGSPSGGSAVPHCNMQNTAGANAATPCRCSIHAAPT